MLTLVERVVADVSPLNPELPQHGESLDVPAPDLTTLQRSTIRAKVHVWGTATVRDLLAELLDTQQSLQGCAHHRDWVLSASDAGVNSEYLADQITDYLITIGNLARKLDEAVRVELQPTPSWWSRARPGRRNSAVDQSA